MHLRKLAGLAVVAFAVFYAITNPHQTAHAIHTIASGLATLATALATGR